MNLVTKN